MRPEPKSTDHNSGHCTSHPWVELICPFAVAAKGGRGRRAYRPRVSEIKRTLKTLKTGIVVKTNQTWLLVQ